VVDEQYDPLVSLVDYFQIIFGASFGGFVALNTARSKDEIVANKSGAQPGANA